MRIHRHLRFALLLALAAAWAGVMFFFSGQSAADSGALSGRFVRLLFGWLLKWGVPYDLLHHIVRKAAHFCVFMLEGVLLCAGMRCELTAPRALAASAALCAAFAVGNELHQQTAVGRACSPVDMGIDFAGALTGILLTLAVGHALGRHKSTSNNER